MPRCQQVKYRGIPAELEILLQRCALLSLRRNAAPHLHSGINIIFFRIDESRNTLNLVLAAKDMLGQSCLGTLPDASLEHKRQKQENIIKLTRTLSAKHNETFCLLVQFILSSNASFFAVPSLENMTARSSTSEAACKCCAAARAKMNQRNIKMKRK